MNVSPWLSIVLSVCALGVSLFALLERPEAAPRSSPDIPLEAASAPRPPSEPSSPSLPQAASLGGQAPAGRLTQVEVRLARVRDQVAELARSPFVTNTATSPAVSKAGRLEMAVVFLDEQRVGSSLRVERDRTRDGAPARSEWLHLPLRSDIDLVHLEALDGPGHEWRALREWEQDGRDLLVLYQRTIDRGGSTSTKRPLVNAQKLRVWFTR